MDDAKGRIYDGGIARMNLAISNTAEYGEYVSGPRVVNAAARAGMKRILADIQSGKFARDWMDENKADLPFMQEMRARRRAPDRGGRRTSSRHDALA